MADEQRPNVPRATTTTRAGRFFRNAALGTMVAFGVAAPPEAPAQQQDRTEQAQAEDTQYDRVAQLRSQQQQTRIAEVRATEEAERLSAEASVSGSGSSSSVFGIGRDEIDESVSRFLIKPEPVELILGAIPWFNLKLFWGDVVKKGNSKVVAPVSFKPWRIPLPDILAKLLVVFVDLILVILVVPSLFIDFLLLYLVGKAITDPIGAVNEANALFGAFGSTLVQWLGFP